mgnify:FL=1
MSIRKERPWWAHSFYLIKLHSWFFMGLMWFAKQLFITPLKAYCVKALMNDLTYLLEVMLDMTKAKNNNLEA